MRRRTLLVLAASAALVPPAFAAASLPGEIRVGASPALARRMAARLGIPVRAVGQGRVAALDAGHLELALLSPAELQAARARMGDRLLVLDETADGGRTAVTRRVLPLTLRAALDAAARG